MSLLTISPSHTPRPRPKQGTLDSAYAALTPTVTKQGQKRKRAPFDEISHTAKYYRMKELEAVASELVVPLEAVLKKRSNITNKILLLPTSTRKAVGKLNIARVTGERTIRRLKIHLAAEWGTATDSFPNGSYVRDPLKLVRRVRESTSTPFICVGGDAGAGCFKLGITYINKEDKQDFFPLIMRLGNDNFDDCKALASPLLARFEGESANFTSIWQVLQHLISSTEKVFLNGDWKFISAVLGHKGPTSNHPCIICTVKKKTSSLWHRTALALSDPAATKLLSSSSHTAASYPFLSTSPSVSAIASSFKHCPNCLARRECEQHSNLVHVFAPCIDPVSVVSLMSTS
jgi:hypothetical protein